MSANLFLVQHSRETEDGTEHTKFIGVYTTEAEAKLAVQRVKNEPGFLEVQGDFLEDGEGFHIGVWKFGDIEWSEGFFTE